MELSKLKNILEAVLLAAERTLTVIQMETLFELDEERPTRDEIRKALHEMAADYEDRGYQLKQVASGFRLQVREEYATWVGRLWEEKPARYTRALLETMALIAYRQPITRGEIEEVRGVSVSSNIIKTLMERDWIKVLGHKDVPGRPALYGSTKEFLDYFNLKSLDQLPTLAEIKDLDSIHPELALDEDVSGESSADDSPAESVDTKDTADSVSAEDQSEGDIDGKQTEGSVEAVATESVDDENIARTPVAEAPVVEAESVADEQDRDESAEDDSAKDESNGDVRSAFNA